jgi:hypothetical protein
MDRGWLRPAHAWFGDRLAPAPRVPNRLTALLGALEPRALIGLMVRPLCWTRGQHRWRVPSHALLAECSELVVQVRCADCGYRHTMRGGVIQHSRIPRPVGAPEPAHQSIRPRITGVADVERCVDSALLQVARRQGYEDGLLALGVPRVDAARRAIERYP